MKKILVAVDFSSCSRRAFQNAVSIARAFDADLHVVHVVPEMSDYLNPSAAILPIRPGASGLERQVSQLILDEFKGSAEEFARIDKAILEGTAWLEILKEANRAGASLIIMGTHGRSAIGRAVLGSVSDRVLHNSPLPVLCVPETGQAQPESMLVCVDDDSAATETLLCAAGIWRAALNARMTILRVLEVAETPELYDLPEDVREDLNLAGWEEQIRQSMVWTASRLFGGETAPSIEILHGPAPREICRRLEEGEFDLCVLGSARDAGAPLGRTAMRVVHRCPCSVLVVP